MLSYNYKLLCGILSNPQWSFGCRLPNFMNGVDGMQDWDLSACEYSRTSDDMSSILFLILIGYATTPPNPKPNNFWRQWMLVVGWIKT